MVATASNANVARVWSTATGLAVSPPLRHFRTVAAVAFAPDSRRVATASWDGTAQVWDARAGTRVGRLLVHDGHVNDLCFSPDGRRLATGSEDATVRLWDVATGQPLTEPLRYPGPVARVRFNDQGQGLITQGADGSLHRLATPDFRDPPPPWLVEIADTIAGSDPFPDPAMALARFIRYRTARSAVHAAVRTSADARGLDDPFARLAGRLFPSNGAGPIR